MRCESKSADRGSILVCVLVCLGIATTILLVSVRSSLRERRQIREEMQLQQTRWLLEAGMRRGVSEFNSQEDYQGELWQVSPALESYPQAMVEIEVAADELNQNRKRLRVTARIGGDDNATNTTQRSETLTVTIPAKNNPTENE